MKSLRKVGMTYYKTLMEKGAEYAPARQALYAEDEVRIAGSLYVTANRDIITDLSVIYRDTKLYMLICALKNNKAQMKESLRAHGSIFVSNVRVGESLGYATISKVGQYTHAELVLTKGGAND